MSRTTTALRESTALTAKRMGDSVVRYVGALAGTAGLAVLAVRHEVVLALAARDLVHVRAAPRVERHRLAQIGSVPLRLACGPFHERLQAFLRTRISAGFTAGLSPGRFPRPAIWPR